MQKHCSIQILGIKRLLKATLKGIPLPMRLLIIMLCVSIGCIRATNTYAQNAVLDLKVNNQTIETVLKIIESRTDFVFFFNSQQVNVHKRVSINVNKQNIFKILDEVFKGSDVVYSVLDKSIILSSKRFAPDGNLKKITGKVVDTNGEPLIGVTIALQGSNRGTVSDVNGNFSLNGEEGKVNVLNISYIGYKDQQVKVEDGKTLIITLEEDTKVLEEVVVVGYGTQKKINLTGAVAVVDDKQVIGRSADNLSKLLQGAVPNMNVTVSNGRPGQGGSINIRGINSISSSATPLILVDGVEGTIDAVNPNDVESISVLKDASSAAVYGARAAYGVILVTTKSGNDGKTRVSYNGRYSFGSPTVSRDFETRGYYSAAINDMFYSTYQGSNYTNYNDEDYYEMWIRRNDKTENPERPWVVIKDGEYKYYGNFDWYNYFMDESRPTWEHNISVSGGNKKVHYFLSGAYYDQKGVIRKNMDSFTKYNFRSKVSIEIAPWLKISNNTSYKKDSYPFPGPGAINNLFDAISKHALASIVPINPDGTYMGNATVITGGYRPANDLSAILEYGKHKNEDTNYFFNTTFEAVMTPVKNVTVTANYSFAQHEYTAMNRSANYPYSRVPGEVLWKTDGYGLNTLYERSNHDWFHSYNIYGNYTNTFADVHHVSATAGVNYETKFFKDIKIQRNDLLSEDLTDFNLANGDEMSIAGGKNRYALFGLFYRLNYDYKNRYLFEFSGRYDGSSRFARGHRYGFFPSVSAGWRINEEKFFAPLRKQISNLKLRFSLGALGNQQVGYYDYLQTISSGGTISYAFGDKNKASGASISAPNASDFTWETVVTKNIGLDFGILDNRLNMTADIYVRDTKDMLMASKDLPNVYGASSPKTNAANLRTKGWEASISWNDSFNLKGKAFHYSVVLGLADNTTKVTKYNNDNKTLGTPYEGQQLGEIWGYVVDGLFKTDEEAENYPVNQSYVNNILNISVKSQGLHAGDVKYVDLDGDNIISPTLSANDVKDQKVIGNSLPRYTYSVRLAADWNGIDFSALLQGVGRQHWYPNGETSLFWGPYARPYCTFIPKDFLTDVWSEDNPDAYFPRPRGYVALDVNPRELSKPNTRYLQNVAYCRLKNVTVGYSLPRTWLKALHMERVRVYFSGENLFTFSPLHSNYIDPEHAGASTSWKSGHTNVTSYPMSKTYSFGIDVTF